MTSPSRFLFLVLVAFSLTTLLPVVADIQPGTGERVQDIPPAVTVEMAETDEEVNMSGNETETVRFGGIVTSNYPGLSVQIGLIVYFDNISSAVDPIAMFFKGQGQDPFTVTGVVPANAPDNSTYIGRLVITVIVTYPGGSKPSTISSILSILVHNDQYPVQGGDHEGSSSSYPGPESTGHSDTVPLVGLAIVLVVLSITERLIRKRMKAKAMKRSRKGRRT